MTRHDEAPPVRTRILPDHGISAPPLIAALGVLTTANAVLGLRARSTPLPVGVTDALLKLGLGVWMLTVYPALPYA